MWSLTLMEKYAGQACTTAVGQSASENSRTKHRRGQKARTPSEGQRPEPQPGPKARAAARSAGPSTGEG